MHGLSALPVCAEQWQRNKRPHLAHAAADHSHLSVLVCFKLQKAFALTGGRCGGLKGLVRPKAVNWNLDTDIIN